VPRRRSGRRAWCAHWRGLPRRLVTTKPGDRFDAVNKPSARIPNPVEVIARVPDPGGTDPTVSRSLARERGRQEEPRHARRRETGYCVLVVFWFNAAVAQEGYLGQDHDKWHHSFYQTLERPDTKSPCCNLTDCRPTSGRQVDGHYEVKVNGAWVSVLPGKILKQSAPDLGFHVCAPFKFDGRPDHLYCVVVPPES